MIPKVLHYVWLSGSPKPQDITSCIESWKEILPDYEIREWKMQDFPMEKMPYFVLETISVKKWAFTTDYLRLWILYHKGGIYLDSDILMKKRIDDFLDNGFFSFIEYHEEGFLPYRNRIDENGRALTELHVPGFCLQAAFMGAEKGHPFIKSCMEYYDSFSFLRPEGKPDYSIIAPDIFALCARQYGFLYQDRLQHLENRMTIYPSDFVAGTKGEITEGNYAVHCCAGSWRDIPKVSLPRKIIRKVKSIIKRCKIQ